MSYQEKLDYYQRKIVIFFLGRIYFTSDDGHKNMFVYRPTLMCYSLKKTSVRNILLIGNQKQYIVPNT